MSIREWLTDPEILAEGKRSNNPSAGPRVKYADEIIDTLTRERDEARANAAYWVGEHNKVADLVAHYARRCREIEAERDDFKARAEAAEAALVERRAQLDAAMSACLAERSRADLKRKRP